MKIIGSASAIRAAFAGLAAIAALGLSGAATAVAATPSAAFDAPPAEKITVDVVTVNGSGCPAGTVSVTEFADNTGFRITYRDFIVRDGGNSAPTDFRQNCQVSLVVHVPQGFTYAIASADYKGRASLPSGSTALQRTNYYFQGSSDNNFADHPFTGPFSGAWRTTDTTAVTELVYAPCGVDRGLNINTELRVNSAKAASWMSMRSSDGDIDTVVHFGWKHC